MFFYTKSHTFQPGLRGTVILVGGDGDVILISQGHERGHLLSGLRLPHLQDPVLTSADHQPTVWRHGDSRNIGRVPGKVPEILIVLYVPQLDQPTVPQNRQFAVETHG